MKQGRFTFILEDEEGFGITATIPEGENIDRMLEFFEDFLHACGYRLKEGESFGIVVEEDPKDRDDFSDPFRIRHEYITDGLFADDTGSVLKWDSGMGSFASSAVKGGMSSDTITFDNA